MADNGDTDYGLGYKGNLRSSQDILADLLATAQSSPRPSLGRMALGALGGLITGGIAEAVKPGAGLYAGAPTAAAGIRDAVTEAQQDKAARLKALESEFDSRQKLADRVSNLISSGNAAMIGETDPKTVGMLMDLPIGVDPLAVIKDREKAQKRAAKLEADKTLFETIATTGDIDLAKRAGEAWFQDFDSTLPPGFAENLFKASNEEKAKMLLQEYGPYALGPVHKALSLGIPVMNVLNEIEIGWKASPEWKEKTRLAMGDPLTAEAYEALKTTKIWAEAHKTEATGMPLRMQAEKAGVNPAVIDFLVKKMVGTAGGDPNDAQAVSTAMGMLRTIGMPFMSDMASPEQNMTWMTQMFTGALTAARGALLSKVTSETQTLAEKLQDDANAAGKPIKYSQALQEAGRRIVELHKSEIDKNGGSNSGSNAPATTQLEY